MGREQSGTMSSLSNEYSVNAYWKECSSGKIWLTGKCMDDWIEMPKSATEYGYGGNASLIFCNEFIDDLIECPWIRKLISPQ